MKSIDVHLLTRALLFPWSLQTQCLPGGVKSKTVFRVNPTTFTYTGLAGEDCSDAYPVSSFSGWPEAIETTISNYSMGITNMSLREMD